MYKYICDRCTYSTKDKRDFEKHLNRKIPCNINRKHKNIINDKRFFCKECDHEFASNQSLKRHNKNFHNNKFVINGDVNGDINNININKQNNNIENQNININITIPEIVKYDYDDINDLTLYEQYLSLTSRESPYTALLDHINLNPSKNKYHNIKYKDIHKNTIDVYNGEKWVKELVNNAVANVIDSKRILIELISERFRIFINDKAINLTSKAIYYGSGKKYYFHKKVVQHMKIHLYNNRNNNEEPDTDIPEDRNDDIWWALSKKFDWKDVEKYINKMDKYEIDFSENLDEIKNAILQLCKEKKHLKNFFKKLLKRISKLIDDFKKNPNYVSGSGDTCDTSDDNNSDSGNNSNDESHSDTCEDNDSNNSDSGNNSNNESHSDSNICSNKIKKSKKKSSNSESDSEPNTNLKKNYKKSFSDNESDNDPKIYSRKNDKKIKKKSSNNESDSNPSIYSIKINKKFKNNSSDEESDNNLKICPKKNNNKIKKNLSDNESDDNPNISPKKSKRPSNNKSDNESDNNPNISPKKSKRPSNNESDNDPTTCSKKINKKSKKSLLYNYPDACSKKISKKSTNSSNSEPDISPNEIRKKLKNEFSDFDVCPKKFRIKS